MKGKIFFTIKANFFSFLGVAGSQFILAYLTLYIQEIYPVWSAPFWPASGAALAACLLRGPRMLLGVYIGLALPNLILWSPKPSWIGLILPVGNVLETGFAWFLLNFFNKGFDYRFSKVKHITRFLLLAPWIPASISAVFVQTILLWTGLVPLNRLLGEMLVFWLGNATGIMLVTPLILVWRDFRKYRWTGKKGTKIMMLIFLISTTLVLLHNPEIPTAIRMTSVLLIPLFIWGVWSTGIRGTTLLCLLSSFTYFIMDVPQSRPLGLLLNENHLKANIGFIGALKVDSPLNRILPSPDMLEEALEEIGILTTLCLTLLPLGVAADELRIRGEQDDLVMQSLDASFWTWSSKDGLVIQNENVARNISPQRLLFQGNQLSGSIIVPSVQAHEPGYLSHWAVTESGPHQEPLLVNGFLQSRKEILQRDAAEEKALLATMEIQSLRSHLNPHLIFNCLTGLRGMIKANPDLARDFTGRLARFLRAVVDSQVSTLITLDHELEICQDYIRLEAIRGRSVSFSHHPDPCEKGVFLPPLSVVTLVENAVKHGASSEGHLAVHFECRKTGSHSVSISVCHKGIIKDNGKRDTPGGLFLLSKQLKVSYPESSGVELVSLPNEQVEARIQLPLQPAI